MRFLVVVMLTAGFAVPAYPQTAPPVTAPPAPVIAPAEGPKLTKLFCKPLCDKAVLGKLSGSEMDGFTACADALLCLEPFPPVAVERPPLWDPFNPFAPGPWVNG